MFNQFIKPLSMLFAAFGISLALTTNCYALFLTTSTSTSFFKTLTNGNDLVCQADDGEMSVDASISPDSFVMESPIDDGGSRISHTCCEVEHDSGLSVADCEAVDENGDPLPPVDVDGNPRCTCGEFTLDQKVEDDTADADDDFDPVPSNCLEAELDVDVAGLETYRCQVSNGAPKETWVWHLVPVTNKGAFKGCDDIKCDDAAANCGVAMGTTDNAKAGDHPYGIVWEYKQYRDPNNSDDSTNILLADFQGNWCHTGSFCLDDNITCSVKKLDLLTNSTAEYIYVEVDTVNTFNYSNTNGNTPTDFLSAVSVIDGELVDPTIIDTTSITINGTPVEVLSSTSDTDRNGDGYLDLRTHISTDDYQSALGDNCSPGETNIIFKGTFTDGRGWIGPTTVTMVCN